MLDSKKRLFYSLIALLVIGASFFIGLKVGRNQSDTASSITSLQNTATPTDLQVDFSTFWKAWQILDEKFVSSSTTTAQRLPDNQDRVWGAISGMVNSLGDPYTVFLPPEQAKIFEGDINGNFEGVGMEIGIQDGVLTVISPLKDTPASRAGIKSGDKIIKIDGTSTEKLNTDQAVKLIRGKVGTSVKFTIIRGDSKVPLEISVTRAVIDIPTINYELRKDGVFVIRLYTFTSGSPDLFRNALREFIKTGSDKLVIDLRGNPGGFLEAAVDISSWFLPAGDVVVREEFKDGRDQILHKSLGYHIFSNRLKLAILIDKGSASASEILAGALSEHGVATLVGDNSFGKGSVQELIKITPEASLKVTIAQWLTPNGKSISAGGLKPSILVPITADDVKAGRDPQLSAAVNFLLKK